MTTTLRSFKRASGGLRAALAATLLACGGGHALAAGASVGVIDHDWSFEGPLGTFDRAELQRGWQVYREVCSSCHSVELLAFRDLGAEDGPAFPPEQVRAIAAEFEIPTLDEWGEPTTRPATPADKIPGPYANRVAAEAANGGAYPPDLSLITKARAGYTGIITQMVQGMGGPEYVYSLLNGYSDEPPEGFELSGALNYNRYFPGHRIAMGQPLYEDSVAYMDGTPATVEQMSHDVTAFLTWAAEPKMVERKQAGLRNLVFLAILAVLLYFVNKKIWRSVKEG